MTTATDEPQVETESATETTKPEPMVFESREDRENYYRWVYCVKHNITDMERFGVKPLGPAAESSETASQPSSQVLSPPRRGRSSVKPGETINLEMSPGMVTAAALIFKAFGFVGTLFRYAWNFCAIVTATTLLGVLIGWLIA